MRNVMTFDGNNPGGWFTRRSGVVLLVVVLLGLILLNSVASIRTGHVASSRSSGASPAGRCMSGSTW